MSSIVRVGNLQLTGSAICQHLSQSSILPQLLRQIILDDALSQWQSSSIVTSATELASLASDSEASELRAIELQQFKQATWGNKVGSYYLIRKSQLDRVIFSVIQIADGEIAQELFFQAQSNREIFAKLAIQYSQGATATNGGRIGPISITKLHPLIADRLSVLNLGELSPLFVIENFYTFLLLEEFIPAPFDRHLRQLLLDELFERWLQGEVADRIGKISVRSVLN
jgi:PPIC-type PPIASE domain